MEKSWIFIGALVFCAIITVMYLIIKNKKDEKETEKFFNEEIRKKKDIELDDF